MLEQSLILPSETTCCQVMCRLHSLQQKYQPIIPRHMHFLRLTALREHSLPEGLITVLRDPCQYYPGSKVRLLIFVQELTMKLFRTSNTTTLLCSDIATTKSSMTFHHHCHHLQLHPLQIAPLQESTSRQIFSEVHQEQALQLTRVRRKNHQELVS